MKRVFNILSLSLCIIFIMRSVSSNELDILKPSAAPVLLDAEGNVIYIEGSEIDKNDKMRNTQKPNLQQQTEKISEKPKNEEKTVNSKTRYRTNNESTSVKTNKTRGSSASESSSVITTKENIQTNTVVPDFGELQSDELFYDETEIVIPKTESAISSENENIQKQSQTQPAMEEIKNIQYYKYRGFEQKNSNDTIEKGTEKSNEQISMQRKISSPVDLLASLDKTEGMEQCLLQEQESRKTKLNLYEVIDRALCNDKRVRNLWLQLKRYEIAYSDSYSGYYPQIALNTNYAKQYGEQRVPIRNTNLDVRSKGDAMVLATSVELNWLLYDFGLREANIKKAKNDYFANHLLVRSELQEIILQTAQKYYSVLAAKAYLNAARKNEKGAKESYIISQDRRKSGIAVLSDELQAQNSYSSYEYNRQRTEGDYRKAMGDLVNIIGYPIDTVIQLDEESLSIPEHYFMDNVNVLIEKSLEQHPKLLAAKQQVISSEYGLSASKSSMLPQISLGASTNMQNYDSRHNSATIPNVVSDYFQYDRITSSSIGINLRIPIFTGFRNYHQMLDATNSLNIAKNELEKQQQEIMIYVWRAYQDLESATKKLRTVKELLASSKQAVDLSRGRYRAGITNILEVLNTQNNLSQAEVYLVDTQAEWHISRLSLVAALGLLDLNGIRETEVSIRQ